jgi:hypothetical protein
VITKGLRDREKSCLLAGVIFDDRSNLVGRPRKEMKSFSVNCETRKTKLSVPGFGDYMLSKKDKQRASKP